MKLSHIRAQRRVSRFFSHRSFILLVLYAFGMGIILLSLLVNWPARGVPSAHAHSSATQRVASPQKGKARFGMAIPRAGTVPAPASIDALSTRLSSYLASLGS